MQNRGFTLIEILIVLALIGILFAFSYISHSNYIASVKLNAETKQITSNLRAAQNEARVGHKTISVTINNKTIRFAPSGFCPPGYSGTIVVVGKNRIKKIIVSPNGRIRIE